VRQAFGFIIDAARARQALLDLQAIESSLGRSPWRDLVKALRHDRGRFGAVISDGSARIALRWALGDLGLAARAGRRWLHHLRDNPVVRRRTIDRALEARLLQRNVGRIDRHDRVVLVQGVSRAYQLLSGIAADLVALLCKAFKAGCCIAPVPTLWLANHCAGQVFILGKTSGFGWDRSRTGCQSPSSVAGATRRLSHREPARR